MNVNNINKVTGVNSYGKDSQSVAIEDSKHPIKAPASKSDSYIPNTEEMTVTYTRDDNTIARLKIDAEKQTQQLRDIVEKLILAQGEKFKETGLVEIDRETALQAQEDISENGYWGVKQTSERLFEFAVGLTGGDPSKAQSMKDAFIKGFEQARIAWGGELPEISNKTYEATIKMFDEWIEKK